MRNHNLQSASASPPVRRGRIHEGHPMKFQRVIRAIPLAFAFFLPIGLAIPLSATQTAETGRPADVQTLRLAKSGSDIQLTCTDGVGPEFGFARNNLVTFSDPASLVLNIGSTCALTDVGELSLSNTRFYIVADSQAPPRVMDTSPLAARPGDTLTVRGLGLKNAIVTTPRGNTPTPTLSTSTTLSYDVPLMGETSGRCLIITVFGADHTGFLNVMDFLTAVNNTLYDTAFYQDASDMTRRLIVTSREGGANKVYVINPDTLTNSSLALGPGTPNPMGLSLGMLTDNKTYAFYGPGNVVTGTMSATPVYKLDILAVPPVQTTFRNISFASGNDNVNVRATSFVPTSAGAPENEVFVFNPNPASGTVRDIRLGKEVTTGFTTWANITSAIGGNTVDRNYPAGLGVRDGLVTNGRFSFHATNGLTIPLTPAKSQVLYYNSDTTVPTPNHTLLWTSPFDAADVNQAKPYVTNGAQIAVERWGEEFAFLADRGNTNPPAGFGIVPSRVFKMNTNLCLTAGDCPATGVTKAFLSAFEYEKAFTDIKGVAIQKGTASSGGSYSKFLWLVNKIPAGFPITGYGISQVRALREIPVRVMIGQHFAGKFIKAKDPNKDVPPKDVIEWLNANIARVNKILYFSGYQLKFDASTDLMQNLVDNDNADYSYTTADLAGNCPADLQALAIRGAADPKRINIFVVHGIKNPDGTPSTSNGQFKKLNNTCATTNIDHVMLMNYIANEYTNPGPGAYNDPASDTVISHELYHKLTANVLSGGGFGYDNTGHRPLVGGLCINNHLMCPNDHLSHMNLKVSGAVNERDDDIANVTGIGTELVLPDFGVVP